MLQEILEDDDLSDKKKTKILKRVCNKIKKPLPMLCTLLQKQMFAPKSMGYFVKKCRSIYENAGYDTDIAKELSSIMAKAIAEDRLNITILFCVYKLQRILISEFKKSNYDIDECKILVKEETFDYLLILLNQKQGKSMPKTLYSKVKQVFYDII